MRLDKFLKVSRLIKRRTLAKEVAGVGRILINGKMAKPASGVEQGDRITLDYGSRQVVVEVLELRESSRAGDAREMFRVLEEHRTQGSEPWATDTRPEG